MTNNFELAVYSRDELYKDLKWLDDNNTNVREEN
jgi:NADH-quinone oxidoreductase subunit I